MANPALSASQSTRGTPAPDDAATDAMAVRTVDTIVEVATWLPEEHANRTRVKLSTEALNAMLIDARQRETHDEKDAP